MFPWINAFSCLGIDISRLFYKSVSSFKQTLKTKKKEKKGTKSIGYPVHIFSSIRYK